MGNHEISGFSGWQVIEGRSKTARMRRSRRAIDRAWTRSIAHVTTVLMAVAAALTGVFILCLGWIAACDWIDGVLLRGAAALTGSR